MIERLVAMGLVETDQRPQDSEWQGQCARRPLKWLIAEHYIALGLRIEPPPQPQWVTQASLVLAACEEGWDCCLDHRDEQWIFWRCYSCKIDDESLVSSVKMQLALARYLEQELLKPTPVTHSRIWRNKL
ncbi:hypothetical protein ACODM8_01770 [Vibrio ostreicida]|uniref:hypothetical protein n=1 Tax=Vibrio ostreicida TaxID=526588 RepID=UPI003B58B7E7